MLNIKNQIINSKYIHSALEILHKIFSKILLFQFVTTGLLICFQAYALSKVYYSCLYMNFHKIRNLLQVKISTSDDFIILIKVCAFLVCTLSGIYFLCHYGNKLNIHSANLSAQLFHTRWYYQTRKYKQKLMLLQERLNHPLKFDLCGFTELNFETFLSV